MPRTLEVAAHLSPAELVACFQTCTEGAEKLRWQAVMLKQEGRGTSDIAQVCKHNVDWVRRTVRKYNAGGPEALRDARGQNGRDRFLDADQLARLGEVVRQPCPYGGDWSGRKVSKWVLAHLSVKFTDKTGISYLHRLKMSRQVPRPRHRKADEEAQQAFKKGGSKQP